MLEADPEPEPIVRNNMTLAPGAGRDRDPARPPRHRDPREEAPTRMR